MKLIDTKRFAPRRKRLTALLDEILREQAAWDKSNDPDWVALDEPDYPYHSTRLTRALAAARELGMTNAQFSDLYDTYRVKENPDE